MGYGLQRFIAPIDPNLICGICSAVLEDAVLTPCGHTFCSRCITTWLGRPSTDTCPECRSNVSMDHVKPVLSLRNLINGFDVECDFNDRGCKVIVKLDRLKSHLETCGYVPVECAGCSNTISRFELAAHQIRCEAIANSIRDDDDDNDASHRLSNIRFNHSLNSSDISELISKIANLEYQVKTLKRDLQISESKNRVLDREYRKTKEELQQKRSELIEINSDFDPDYEYGYTPQSIAKLSFLIARFLLKKPAYIDRDKIFSAVRRCYDKYARCGSEFEHDVHMLLATAFASNWFSESYRTTIHYWLQGVVRYRQIMTNSSKYQTLVK
ncbi:E3 ubiquitin-protein ligase NRDP1-like [Ruditapes philippinarum]|uniref:E3 ubiquitin-protein ligase NRDP1-like n=1 Tax=Ruditapes philippinarum TaxID=129788 RepID=UPI00295BCC2A|nr:E3 ubiquitin-protein ligase NRDP1-like [Ruditapes philippinarum]